MGKEERRKDEKAVLEIMKDLGPAAEEERPNMHVGPADELQVEAEAHKFQRSSRSWRT